MSNEPAPRCPGCGGEMELTEVSKHTWRYSCEDCGWRSPLVRGLGKEGKDVAYDKAMQRYTESPWISVKDRQPDPEQTVVNGYRAGILTHWMPIPPLPKEGE